MPSGLMALILALPTGAAMTEPAASRLIRAAWSTMTLACAFSNFSELTSSTVEKKRNRCHWRCNSCNGQGMALKGTLKRLR